MVLRIRGKAGLECVLYGVTLLGCWGLITYGNYQDKALDASTVVAMIMYVIYTTLWAIATFE